MTDEQALALYARAFGEPFRGRDACDRRCVATIIREVVAARTTDDAARILLDVSIGSEQARSDADVLRAIATTQTPEDVGVEPRS